MIGRHYMGIVMIVTLKKIIDSSNRFVSYFNQSNGFYLRTGVFDANGNDTGKDPFMASFPQLIDIGIMGHCIHGASGLCLQSGVQCYQGGLEINEPNMNLADLIRIIDECKNKTFQVALGGRGDPDQHENFEDIIAYCAGNGVVPNFTTSGFNLNKKTAELCKYYCGAVAVSWYRHKYTMSAINLLLDAGVKTNIHYVLGKNSVEEANWRIKNRAFPPGINAVVFLLHKPVGMGQEANILRTEDPLTLEFFSLIDSVDYPFKVGFDSCTIPAFIEHNLNIDHCFLDTCEGARFSCYICPDLKMTPCSFDQKHRWVFYLSEGSITEGWNSPQFEKFRDRLRHSCPDCVERDKCMGGCPIEPEIVLCNKLRREGYQ
jgi:radical SAM protein with 4Fe4S-binding SPASM domain